MDQKAKTGPRAELNRIWKKEALWKLDGPAPMRDKELWKELALRQVQQRHIPPFLRNDVLFQTKRDPKLGRIQVKRMTGLTTSPATKIVRKFEEMVGSREELAEKMAHSGRKLTPDETKLIDLLETAPGNKSLATLMAEAGVKPSRVLKLYAEGAIALGKVEAAIAVSRNQPQVIKDLLRNALDKEVYCQTCVGTGLVKKAVNSKEETRKCPSCSGSGTRYRSSKHKQFAMEKVLRIGKVIDEPKKGGDVNVSTQVGVGVKVGEGGGFMEKILHTSDKVLYGRSTEIVDAEPTGGAAGEGDGDPEAEVQGSGDDGDVVGSTGEDLGGGEEGELQGGTA
jgi:hypothetical protein